MRLAVLTLSTLATVIAAAPALGAEPVVIQPNGPWSLDHLDEKCLLTRLFGEGENTHFLAFQQHWPAAEAGVTAAGPAYDRFRSLARTDVRFYEAQEAFEAIPFTGMVGAYGPGVIFGNLRLDRDATELKEGEVPGRPVVPQMDLALARQAQFVELRQGNRTVRLVTGALDEAFAALNQCTLYLLRDWGLDPARLQTAQSGPRWINEDALVRRIVADYPRDALMQGEQGIMRMRVIVGADGTVESCTIISATKTDRLQSPACDVMARARFEPARDANGTPFRSLYATSITYRMR